jgi:hypothetical protein
MNVIPKYPEPQKNQILVVAISNISASQVHFVNMWNPKPCHDNFKEKYSQEFTDNEKNSNWTVSTM